MISYHLNQTQTLLALRHRWHLLFYHKTRCNVCWVSISSRNCMACPFYNTTSRFRVQNASTQGNFYFCAAQCSCTTDGLVNYATGIKVLMQYARRAKRLSQEGILLVLRHVKTYQQDNCDCYHLIENCTILRTSQQQSQQQSCRLTTHSLSVWRGQCQVCGKDTKIKRWTYQYLSCCCVLNCYAITDRSISSLLSV